MEAIKLLQFHLGILGINCSTTSSLIFTNPGISEVKMLELSTLLLFSDFKKATLHDTR